MLSTINDPVRRHESTTKLSDLIEAIPGDAGAEGLRKFLEHDTVRLYHGRSSDPSMAHQRNWGAMGAGLYLTSRDRAGDYATFRAQPGSSAMLDMYTIRPNGINFYICETRRLPTELVEKWERFLESKLNNPPEGFKGDRLRPNPQERWNFNVKTLLNESRDAKQRMKVVDTAALIYDAWGESLFPQFMQSQGFGGMAGFELSDATLQELPVFVIFNRSGPYMELSGSHVVRPAATTGAGDPFREASFTAIERSHNGSFRAIRAIGN